MQFDKENCLSDSQVFTGAATVSTNSFKKQTAAQDLSIGDRKAVVVLPTVDAGAGSTQVLEAIQADDGALTTNVTVIGSITLPAAKVTKGKMIEIPIAQGMMTQQYLGWRHTATGGITTLTAEAYIVRQEELTLYKSFPKQVNAAV